MRKLCVLWALVLLCGFPTAVNADIYAWTDENGVKHFSNHPPSERADVVTKAEELPYEGPSDEERKKAEIAESLVAAWQEIAEIESEVLERQQAAELKIEEANQRAEQAIQEAEALLSEAREKYNRSHLYYGYYPYHHYYPHRYNKKRYRHKKRGIHYKFPHSRPRHKKDFKHRHHSAHYGGIDKKRFKKAHQTRHNVKQRGHVEHRTRMQTHRLSSGHQFKGRSSLSLRLK